MQQVSHTGQPADVDCSTYVYLQQAPARPCTASLRADPAGFVTAVIAAAFSLTHRSWASIG